MMMRKFAAAVKDKDSMNNYTEELKNELDRITMKGNADKETFRKLASIIFRMDARIAELEREVVVDDKPAAPAKRVKKES